MHHDHQVPVDGQHAARAHHQPARHGDLPRHGHRGPSPRRRDPELYYQASTGIAGEQWAQAAAKIGHDLNIPIKTAVIGPGREVTDLYYDLARIREIEEDGALQTLLSR
jgi:hypothetical protein